MSVDEGLHRGLSRWHALAVVVGGVIGTGIYIRPASIAQMAATPGAIMGVWVAAALLSLGGALSYAQLATRIPKSGGEYAYLRETLGELPAFLYGWMRLTVGIGSIAALAVAATVFLADIVPLGGEWQHWTLPWPARFITVSFGARQLIAALIICALALINIRGVTHAGRFQTWATSIKVLGLLGLISGVWIFGASRAPVARYTADLAADAGSTLAYGGALLAAMAAFNGWANVAMLGGEVRNAERNLPWALTAGICIAAILYLAMNLTYLHVLSMPEILSANSSLHPDASSVASRAALVALGQRVGAMLPLLFIVSSLGTLHCNLLAVPRVFFAMARDGLLQAALGRVAVSTRTPVVAIAALAAVGSLLAVLGNYDRLTNMAVFGNLTFYALNAFGLLRWLYRGRPGAAARSRLAMAWIPFLFLTGTICLLAALIVRGAGETITAAAMILAGIPVYFLMRLRRRLRRSR